MSYIKFTEKQKNLARLTDLVLFLQNNGEILKKSGSEYEWKSGSEKITVRGNVWFNQYEREGGDAIDFVMRFYDKNYPEAVEFLLGGNYKPLCNHDRYAPEKLKKSFALPPPNIDMRRIYAYFLKQRVIDRDIINYFTHNKMLYEEKDYHNCVFVGFDENGIPRHAHKRGTFSGSSYKGNISGSLPEYSFHHLGRSNRIYVFEAPIDLLSFVSMNKMDWKNHSYVALCCVGDKALHYQLKANPNISHICLCLDNDKAGIEAENRISKTLENYQVSFLVPKNKDWNIDLLELKAQEAEEISCQELAL